MHILDLWHLLLHLILNANIGLWNLLLNLIEHSKYLPYPRAQMFKIISESKCNN